MIKIIATDMDGTFLKKDGSYDKDRLKNILNTCREKGIVFVAASGRQLLGLKEFFSDFTDDMAFVAENGGIVDYKNTILFKSIISKPDYLKIIDILKNSPRVLEDTIGLSGKNGAYYLDGMTKENLEHLSRYYNDIHIISDFNHVDDEIFKLTVNFPADYVLEAENYLNEKMHGFRAVTTGFDAIDIIPDHLHKATGLAALADYLHAEPDQIVAFGDNLNDLEMLEYAGHAYAVDNARDQVKEVSEYLIGHHDDEAVIHQIEKLINL
jgi:HAD-superfamily hydrolase, subfamily IIB